MWPFGAKRLEEVIFKGKKVKVHGVFFQIRKVNPLDYLTGAKVLKQDFSLYELKKAENLATISKAQIDQMKKHYTDVFMAGVIYPTIKRENDNQPGIWVDHLFNDWTLATELYQEIMFYTYGKKKLTKAYASQEKR